MHHYLLQEEQEETQQLQLSVKCSDLLNQATSAPLDSFFVVKLIEKNRPIRQLAKSKVYWGCSNPQYEEKFNIQFCFKYQQNLLIEVFSHQSKPRLYGWIQTTVSKIFGSKNKMYEDHLKIQSKQRKFSNSKMQIKCKKKQKSQEEIASWKLKIEASQIEPLRKLYFFSQKSPYFFILSKVNKNNRTLIYKSELSTNFVHEEFKEFDVRKKIFQDNYNEYQIRVYQGLGEGQRFVGGFTFSPLDLEVKKPQSFKLINEGSKTVGFLRICLVEEFKKFSFTDYLDAGLEFKVICNIDFTASNKKPTDLESLHRVAGGLSAYEEAMTETLKILLDYDNDKLIPTYGFGAKVSLPNFNSEGKVSHCFPLNGQLANPNLKQLQGVLRTYRKTLNYLQFSGPTNFTQIIKNAINQCETSCSDLSQYTIVFILTDGQLHDIIPVIDLIDKNTHLPLSIIIVGLGDNDFEQMKTLDGDQKPLLNSRGKRVRDIVQFVDFKLCRDESQTLAVRILEELPIQVLNFYAQNKIDPKKIYETKCEKEKDKDKLTGSKIKKSVQFRQSYTEKTTEDPKKIRSKSKPAERNGRNFQDLTNMI